MIYLLNGFGIVSDVDLDKSAETGVWITQNIWQAESVKGGLGAGGEVIAPLRIEKPATIGKLARALRIMIIV